MQNRPRLFLFGLAAAVTVPLAILAILAGLGIHAQKAAAFTRAQEEARAISSSQAQLLSQQLRDSILPIPNFPSPPVPGSPSPADEILDGSDLNELKKLRDDPNAGLSPSGLPRRALATLRLAALFPEEQDPEDIMRLLTKEAPSILTVPALSRLRVETPELSLPKAWQNLDELQSLQQSHPDGGWIVHESETWWLSPAGDQFLPPSMLSTDSLDLPSHALARFSSNSEPLTPPISGTLFARTEIDFPSHLTLDWILTSPEAITASIRQQTRWTLTLLGSSILVSLIGLITIFRFVQHERRLSHLKTQFVSSVSHELRAPVGSIRLMAEALEDNRVEEPRSFHQLIVRESKRLSHLIENVLEFSRLEEGKKRYRFEDCDLSLLVRETLDLFKPRAAEAGQHLEAHLTSCHAKMDPIAIQQALSNLLDNALKFSPPESTIRIDLKTTKTSWTLSISDEAPSIPKAEQSRIFERFYRVEEELRRETEGTGIGLSIVARIVQAHGGKISVSTGGSVGNKFTITAPLLAEISS